MTIAGVAIAAALTMSACSDDGGSTDRTTAQQTTTSAAAPSIAPPTAAELNAALATAFDANVPVEQKAQLVQGAEADPELINQVAKAAKDAGATIEVVDVTPTGDDTVTAGVNLVINGQTNPATVDFVAENGVWKMSKSYACQLVTMAQLTSPACPA
ncbi:YceI family protein [Rhodococcus sp. OK519]|uniref:YceI family protein n=1 Tax=Rhodococcus sp. OK519 TaxID=2135729 RepID=UPI00215994B0